MKQAIPWVTSVVTLWGMYVVGRKNWWGWVIGLGNQVLWLATIILFQTWGLLFLSVTLTVLYTKNLIEWRRA